jgi:hypothetical protein
MDTVLVTWVDEDGMPRAYASGKENELPEIRFRASFELDMYLEKRMSKKREDFTESIQIVETRDATS